METQQEDFCCLSNEEYQSSPDVLCTETRKNIQITEDSRCPPVEMTVCDTKSNETDTNTSLRKINAKSNEVNKTLSADIMNLTYKNDGLQETIPAATSVKIEMSEETQTTEVNTDLCKETYDVVDAQEDVSSCLSVGTKDRFDETMFDDLCKERSYTSQEQITKESLCTLPLESFKIKRNDSGETINHDKKKTKTVKNEKTNAVEKTLSDIMNLTSKTDGLQETFPAATSVKIEMSEETQTTDVNIELCKETYDAVEAHEDVSSCLSFTTIDRETRFDDLCADRGKTAQDQITKESLCITPVETLETKRNEADETIIHGEEKTKTDRQEGKHTVSNIISDHDIQRKPQLITETHKENRDSLDVNTIHAADFRNGNTNKHKSKEILNANTSQSLASEGAYISGPSLGLNPQTCKSVLSTPIDKTEESHTDSTSLKQIKEVDPKPIRIVLIGQTGTGKSSTGNTILGEEKFSAVTSFASKTSRPQKESCIFNGQILEVIDTPGLYDTSKTKDMVKQDLKLCLEMTSPGPHVFLVIISVGRITEQEKYTLKYMSEMFGDEDFLNHTILVITRKEDLDPELDSDDEDEDHDVSDQLKTFIQDSEDLTRIVKQCGGRCLAVSNSGLVQSNKRRRDARGIIQSVYKLIDQNKGVCYSNDMFKELERRKEILRKEEEVKKQRLAEIYEREEMERQTQIRIRKENIKKLEKKIEKMAKESEDQISKLDDLNQELKRELKELEAENKEISRRNKERIEQVKREIKDIEDESEDLDNEIICSQPRKTVHVKSSSKRNSTCRIM